MRLMVLTMSLLLLVFGFAKGQAAVCVGNQGVIIGGESGQELSPVQVFRKNNGTEPGTLDPHRAEGVPASNVLRDLFEGLVMEDPSGRYVPGAAESWTLSQDAKTYMEQRRQSNSRRFCLWPAKERRPGHAVKLLKHAIPNQKRQRHSVGKKEFRNTRG